MPPGKGGGYRNITFRRRLFQRFLIQHTPQIRRPNRHRLSCAGGDGIGTCDKRSVTVPAQEPLDTVFPLPVFYDMFSFAVDTIALTLKTCFYQKWLRVIWDRNIIWDGSIKHNTVTEWQAVVWSYEVMTSFSSDICAASKRTNVRYFYCIEH